jgi:zinc/manganese transport system substrate-binding protein
MRYILGIYLLFCSCFCMAENKIKVVASFSILADIVKNIGGNKVDVVSLVGANQDIHDYELKPSDIIKINNSKLFFINGLGLEGGFITHSIGDYSSNVVDVTKNIPHLSAKTKLDPHVWQDISLVRDYYLPKITQSLVRISPSDRAYFQQNEIDYKNKLDNLDKWAKSQFKQIEPQNRNAVTTHDAFSYLANRYQLHFITVQGVSTDNDATSFDIAKLEDIIKENKVKYVFLENMTNNQLIKQIARDTNVTIGPQLYSDALSDKSAPANTYINLFKYNITALVNTWK